ncbi:glycoside hydrolase family 3 N-terminal domain-containing protein [Paenibacillus lignilyticus]|uniref:beta-N-acetylhexosaminidase n=1 Tax=Paenibacillus lignilyticus TaxID=1172615 RepID=A0ABS5CJH2_9BACL|nr:glycoside hydrolase family 3 N-terminal domain-containing protein [Paenibacillus lignilyticus]MBP3966032.1 S-layer homology domain-containing protein [Paenibacillus lignilyticus]
MTMTKWKATAVGAAAGIAIMVWAGTAAAAGEQFTDLQGARWAEDSITYMAKRGTVAGYGNGRFKPEGAVTRAQAVTFMVRELYPQQLADGEQTYTDVPRSHPFYKEISVAARMGLAGGFPDGTFHPDAPVSRAETAAFLARAYALQSGERTVSLSDTTTHWAAAPIGMMSSNGLIGGYADGTYRPDKSVTLAEFAVFMTRVIRFERENAIQAKDWDKLLSYMTVSEQVGQMLMPDIRQWKGQPTTTVNAGIKETIRDQDLGGLILFEKNILNAKQVTTLTHGLQAEAGDIPLFLGIDQEGGVIKRIPGGTNLPGQMALGAARDASLAEAAGKLTGEELKALGMQLDFAPVLDINSNPDNPIIGMRSFSSDPDAVTRLGLAEIKGLQASGIIPAVKHFPGHGDTTVDSHLGLPVLTHDRARLDAVELKPFRAAIEAGVEMIMSAHIAFPAVDNEHVISRKDGSSVPVPATLSKKVLSGLLREELGFQGVIISDAFTMNGIAEHFGEEQAVVRAVSAGIDIILMPQDSAIAHQALVKAVHNGTLSSEAIHASVKRILQLKAKYGLFGGRGGSLSSKLAALPAVIGTAAHRKVEQDIAERAVTLLAGRDGNDPDRIGEGDRVVIAAADEEIGKQLDTQLRQAGASQHLSTEIVIIGPGKTSAALPKLKGADYVMVASYQFRNVASQFGWSDYQTVIDELNRLGKRYALVSLGNPYELLYLRDVKSGVALYGKQEPNIGAGMNALLGQAGLPGVLPVQ